MLAIEKQNLHRAVVLSGPCFYCGAKAKHADHIDAKVNGGGCKAENLIPACASCNCSKNSRPIDEQTRKAAKIQAFINAPDIVEVAEYLNAKHVAKRKSEAGKDMARLIDFIYKPLRDRGLLVGI